MPGNPFVMDNARLMAVWVLATVVSVFLGLVDPIVERMIRVRYGPG